MTGTDREKYEKTTYNHEILRPATDTYLTTEWDEFVPFPNTWKIRFDGFGRGNYSREGKPFDMLQKPSIPAEALSLPPYYQPQGPSHYGGTFADVSCICNAPDKECKCEAAKLPSPDSSKTKEEQTQTMPMQHALTISSGCGI
jgi:hypothetical protein